jgi:parallel beta-helix repeat protein
MKKLWWAGFFVFMAVLLSVSMVSAATLTVNKPGAGGIPPDYATIQAAIAAANASGGDTIIVYPGDYNPPGGGYVVDRSVIIKGKNGAEKTRIICQNADDNGFIITANNVTISGFTIKMYGAVANGNICGILVGGSAYFTPVAAALTGVVITKCVIEYFDTGIWILKANGTNINNNTTRYNAGYGIFLYSRDFLPLNPGVPDYDIKNTQISHNQIYENQYYGVGIMDADGYGASFDGTKITANTFYRNGSLDYTFPCNWNSQAIYIGNAGAVGTVEVTNNKFLKFTDITYWSWDYIENDAGAGLTLVQSGNKAFNKLMWKLTGAATTFD